MDPADPIELARQSIRRCGFGSRMLPKIIGKLKRIMIMPPIHWMGTLFRQLTAVIGVSTGATPSSLGKAPLQAYVSMPRGWHRQPRAHAMNAGGRPRPVRSLPWRPQFAAQWHLAGTAFIGQAQAQDADDAVARRIAHQERVLCPFDRRFSIMVCPSRWAPSHSSRSKRSDTQPRGS